MLSSWSKLCEVAKQSRVIVSRSGAYLTIRPRQWEADMVGWGVSSGGKSRARYRRGRSPVATAARVGSARDSGTRRKRIIAVMIVVFVGPGLLSLMLTGGPARSQSASGAVPPAPMPLISRGVPAYSSSDSGRPASNANDNDYGTYWRSSGVPAWLAYDLSGIPATQRGNVLLAWY